MWNDNTPLLSCHGEITVKNWWNVSNRNPNPDLNNVNARIKLGKNPMRFTQVIVQNENMDVLWADN